MVYKFVDSCLDDKGVILHLFSRMINEINSINLTLTTFIRFFYYLRKKALYLNLQFPKSETKLFILSRLAIFGFKIINISHPYANYNIRIAFICEGEGRNVRG